MTDPRIEIQRGAEASYLLENPLITAAFADIREELKQQWESSPARDVEGREAIFMMTKMLDRVHNALKTHVTTGKFAAEQLRRDADKPLE